MGPQYSISRVGIFLVYTSVWVKNYSYFSLLHTVFNHEVFGSKESILNTIRLGNVNRNLVRIRKD